METNTMIDLYRQLPRDTQSAFAFAMQLVVSLNQANTTPTPAQTSADLITSTLTPSVKS